MPAGAAALLRALQVVARRQDSNAAERMHVYKVCITAEDDAGPPVDRRFEKLVVVRITTLADLPQATTCTIGARRSSSASRRSRDT